MGHYGVRMQGVIGFHETNQANARFAKAVSMGELTSLADAYVRDLGFRFINVVDFARWRRGPDEKPWLLCTFPLSWVQYYYEAKYGGIDPVPRALVAFPDLIVRSRMPLPADPQHADVMARVRAEEIGHGIEDFIAVPLMRLDVPVGAFFATGPTPVCVGPAGLAVALVAPTIYRRAIELADDKALRLQEKARGNLSRREADCLKWAAAGKTTWEIGAILGISEHTVAVHLRHVNRKLNVSSRAQAVAEAMKRNLL